MSDLNEPAERVEAACEAYDPTGYWPDNTSDNIASIQRMQMEKAITAALNVKEG